MAADWSSNRGGRDLLTMAGVALPWADAVWLLAVGSIGEDGNVGRGRVGRVGRVERVGRRREGEKEWTALPPFLFIESLLLLWPTRTST